MNNRHIHSKLSFEVVRLAGIEPTTLGFGEQILTVVSINISSQNSVD